MIPEWCDLLSKVGANGKILSFSWHQGLLCRHKISWTWGEVWWRLQAGLSAVLAAKNMSALMLSSLNLNVFACPSPADHRTGHLKSHDRKQETVLLPSPLGQSGEKTPRSKGQDLISQSCILQQQLCCGFLCCGQLKRPHCGTSKTNPENLLSCYLDCRLTTNKSQSIFLPSQLYGDWEMEPRLFLGQSAMATTELMVNISSQMNLVWIYKSIVLQS